MAVVQVTNLLTNSSFENTGWSANSNCTIAYATTPVHSGSYSLKVTSTSTSESLIVTSDTIPLIDEHIYYCGVYFWEDTAVCTAMQAYWPIAEPTWGNSHVDSTKLGQWQRLGWRVQRSNWNSGNYQFRFNFEGMNTNAVAYIDDAVLIDLTACFGSGNEPTLDWCNKNIPYVSGKALIGKIEAGDILTFNYTGSVQNISLPKGTYKLECWGAQGGSSNTSYATGGLGGYSVGTITLNDKSTTLYIYVGGQGSYGTSNATLTTKNGGGFNGGGNAAYGGGAGGGGSDIRIGADSLYARVIVAGGGGGAYAYSATYKAAGGDGGGTSGSDGARYNTSYNFFGKGGTQTAGGASNTAITSGDYNGEAGSFGFGGASGRAYSTNYLSNGAGGGGWYGGSGADSYSSSSRARAAGGGGGSGYVYTSSTASQYPSGCQLNSSYYLTSASTTAGQRSGNGYITITVIDVSSCPFRVKTNDSTWKECQSAWIKINSSTWKEIPNTLIKINAASWKSGGGNSPPINIPMGPAITTVNITASNISQYFTVSNGSYYFAGDGSTFTSNNKGVNSTTATTTLTAKYDMDISFSYSYGGESNYDKFTLVVNNTTIVNAASGTNTSSNYSGTLKAGNQISFTFSKDSSQHSYQDSGTFSNMTITGLFG